MAARKTTPKKAPAPAKKKKTAPRKGPRPPMKHGTRADLGAPIDGFFAKQPEALRPITVELRKLIEQAAPDATAAIKWGMPFFTIGGNTMCAIGAHKAHVNLILHGPPGTYKDPGGLLEGEAKTGRHMKLVTFDGFPKAAIQGFLRTAAAFARKGG